MLLSHCVVERIPSPKGESTSAVRAGIQWFNDGWCRILLMPSSLEPSSGVVTEIFQEDIFFLARSSSSSFKRAPRKPSVGKPEDQAQVSHHSPFQLHARWLPTHVGMSPMTKHVHAPRTLDSIWNRSLFVTDLIHKLKAKFPNATITHNGELWLWEQISQTT